MNTVKLAVKMRYCYQSVRYNFNQIWHRTSFSVKCKFLEGNQFQYMEVIFSEKIRWVFFSGLTFFEFSSLKASLVIRILLPIMGLRKRQPFSWLRRRGVRNRQPLKNHFAIQWKLNYKCSGFTICSPSDIQSSLKRVGQECKWGHKNSNSIQLKYKKRLVENLIISQ